MARVAFLAASALLILGAAPTHAASFDCAKAQSPMEKAICGDPELSAADEALAASYKAVLAQLSAEAQGKVRDGQRDWLKYVRTICPPGRRMVRCVKRNVADRTRRLSRSVVKNGDLVLYSVNSFHAAEAKQKSPYGEKFATDQASYPQLDRPTTDGARAWNAYMAAEAKKVTMSSDEDAEDDLGFNVMVLSPDLISGEFTASSYGYGAAHPIAQVTPFNWLLRERRELRAEDLFDRAKPWRQGLSTLCAEAFSKYEEVEDFCAPDHLSADNWTIGTDGLGIQSQEYEIGPYTIGAPLEIIPWDKLKPLLVANPPFAIPPK